MIALAALLLLGPQDAPTDVVAGDEIVVTAKVGRAVLVFDRGADDRLRNCRVLKSSGVEWIDEEACDAFPDCTVSDAGESDCAGDAMPEFELASRDVAVAPRVLSIPDLIKPEQVPEPGVGPLLARDEEDRTAPRLEKLGPPPQAPATAPVVTFGTSPVVEQ